MQCIHIHLHHILCDYLLFNIQFYKFLNRNPIYFDQLINYNSTRYFLPLGYHKLRGTMCACERGMQFFGIMCLLPFIPGKEKLSVNGNDCVDESDRETNNAIMQVLLLL